MNKTHHPNILFIMDDQHRFDYLGCAGGTFVQTPNLDRLAKRSLQFTQCTTNCPVCAPSRIALATGLQPSRLGCVDNSGFLPHSRRTYYQQLRDHGYRVGCVGKLDLAKPDHYNGRYGDRPCVYQWGFTHPVECEGKMHAASSPTPIGPYTHDLAKRGLLQAFHEDYQRRKTEGFSIACWDSVLPTEAFEDVYIGRRSAEWIENIADDYPWHLFVSFVGPHDPYDPPAEYGERYRHATMPAAITDDLTGKPQYVKNRVWDLAPEKIAETRRQYCAAIAVVDDQVGEILAALDRRGLTDNTIVIFASDHGEMLGDHGLYTKSLPYEASLRVPLMVSGPGIQGGRVSDALVELIDVNPTICDLAGIPVLPEIDARSLKPVLCGETLSHRSDTVSAIRNFRCIRTRRHKLVENYNDVTELYDLSADPDELHNIADQERGLVRELSQRLRNRFQEGTWLR
jgi:choline-sulfatase